MVEYTDYQCPFCARYHRTTYADLLAEYGDRIRYVVRHFPLTGIHPQAEEAARAAECASQQGRFFDYHERLFQRSSGLGTEKLEEYADALQLDRPAFDECLRSGATQAVVHDDFRQGVYHGVRSTPTFFINDRMLVGAQPVELFRAAIDTALARAAK